MEIMKLTDEQKFLLSSKVKKILELDKGILAVDEKSSTLEPKFTSNGIANSEENRIAYRDCIFSTPNLHKYIGGVILNVETFKQINKNGMYLKDHLKSKNIEIGVKLDKGLMDFAEHEKISIGIEDLENRIKNEEYADASFCKWRSLFKISEKMPSDECIEQNCIVLCKYALIAQKNGKVPIIEPEISTDGYYSIEEMAMVAKKIYSTLFLWCSNMNIYIPGMILKCSFITNAKRCIKTEDSIDIGQINLSVIIESVPYGIGGIVYLSGGHSTETSFDILSSIQKMNKYSNLTISFSFCRALTASVLHIWRGNDENIKEAQSKFVEVLKECRNANKKNLNK